MDQNIAILQEWIDECDSIVFFSGAAMSWESGIPDFRSIDEHYFKTYDYPPDTILSRPFLERKPKQFFDFYRARILEPLMTAEPNAAHFKVAELEQAGKLRTVITQNIDELHHEAGSRKLLEISGSITRNHCPLCEQRLSAFDLYHHPGIPYCDVDMCGAVISPDIVLYGDPLHPDLMSDAIYNILMADLFIVAGASLVSHPAAGFVHYYARKKMVLINEQPSAMEDRADLVIHAPIREVMGQLTVSNHT